MFTKLVPHAACAVMVGLAALAATGCDTEDKATEPTAVEASGEPRLTLHFASMTRTNELTEPRQWPNAPMPPLDKLYLVPEPVLTGRDVVRIAWVESVHDDDPALEMTLSDDAAVRFEEATEKHIGDQLVFLWDDRIVLAPTIHSSLSSRIMLFVTEDLTEEELRGVGDHLESR